MESIQIFEKLKSILKNYDQSLSIVHDEEDNYYLNTKILDKKLKPEFFGAVQIKKAYVSFHLMPIYYHPELLNDISPLLIKKMQGKSCFNFKEVDNLLFAELNVLTQRCFELYQSLKKI